MLRCGRKSFYQLSVANHWMGCKGNSSFATSFSITTVQLLHLQLIPRLMIQTVLWMKNKWTCQLYFIHLTHVITQWAKDSENVHGGWGFIGWGGDCDKLRSTRWREKLQPNKKVTIKWGKLPPILTEKESSKKRILVSEKLTHTPAMCHYYASSIKILGNTPLGFYFL